jgi:hypothetical protein
MTGGSAVPNWAIVQVYLEKRKILAGGRKHPMLCSSPNSNLSSVADDGELEDNFPYQST